MRQDGPAPPYLLALVALEADPATVGALADLVAADVAHGGAPGPADVAAARAAVEWLISSLRSGLVPEASALRRLRDDAAREARAERPLEPVLDRALSAGWVLWTHVAREGDLSPEALRVLGEALLRTGDAAAAAIAAGHAAAGRELATRSASALRELLDELLDLAPDDGQASARLARRLGEVGIALDLPLTVVVADAGRDLADGDPVVVEVARRLVPATASPVGDPRSLGGPAPGPVVAATHGRLVLLVPRTPRAVDVAGSLTAIGQRWFATSAVAAGPLTAGAAVREATAALGVVPIASAGRIMPAASLALEEAMLAAPGLLEAAIDRELAPLGAARRGSGLVETLEVYLAERENVRATARRLGIAPRTVAYRLERVERLLGGRLDAERRLRLATVLFARRLLAERADRRVARGSGAPLQPAPSPTVRRATGAPRSRGDAPRAEAGRPR